MSGSDDVTVSKLGVEGESVLGEGGGNSFHSDILLRGVPHDVLRERERERGREGGERLLWFFNW